jgi:hypothetical protein
MGLSEEFDQFWQAYPRREAKLAALKAYKNARRLATAEDILAGVRQYKLRMPEDRQYRPLPASFLNAGRWMDEPDVELEQPVKWECTHTPRCNSPVWCEVLRARERGEVA